MLADDTTLVADTAKKFERLVGQFGRVCKEKKLRVKVNKNK